jgi:hypothetical protein
MRPTVSQVFEDVISKPRLDSYKNYFNLADTDEAIGAYMWNCDLSTCFSALMAMFEIALRNNVHRAMSLNYSAQASPSIHWYDRIWGQLSGGTRAKVESVRFEWVRVGGQKVRQARTPAPNPDEIISRVSFGFLPGVLSTLDGRRADQLMSGIFPYHPISANPIAWKTNTIRRNALAFIYELNTFRNRIAHHEPLWKFGTVWNTAQQAAVPVALATNNLTDSLMRFQRLLQQYDEGMHALNADFQKDIFSSTWRQKLNNLLTEKIFYSYTRFHHHPKKIAITPTKFRRTFPMIVKASKPIRVKRNGCSGIFIPD